MQKKVEKISVIPNSIDVFAYQSAGESNQGKAGGLAYDIVFSGKMDYRPNVDAALWFANEVWPKIIAQRPEQHMGNCRAKAP